MTTELNIAAQTPFTARAAAAVFDNRYLLGLGIVIILLSGYSAFINIPRIEDPQIVPRYPQITTLLPGASALRVEALVTDRIEDALREVVELKNMDSSSLPGISIINLELKDEIGAGENEQAFSKIQNQIKDIVRELPAGATQPFFNDKFSAVAFSKVVAISWPHDTPPPLGVMNRLAEELADLLRSFTGSELVRIYGAPKEEVSVTVAGNEIAALGLDAAALARVITASDVKLPAGAMRSDSRNLFVEIDAEIDTLERVRSIPIQRNQTGGVVRIGDIASVEKRWREPATDLAVANGQRSILVAVRTSDAIRLDQWTDDTALAIDEFRRAYGGGLSIETVFNQNVYTEERLSTLGGNLLAGALVVMAVVLVSMGWRASLIVGSSLPLSASLALFGLSAFGQQLHQMAIFGMIISIGLLIDNAIVMTDEVKQNLDKGEPRSGAVRNALTHLFVPLLASTLTTILGFMPVFLLSGAMGDFVSPIAIAVVLSLIGSFALAVTITPALGGLYLRRDETRQDRKWWRDGASSRELSSRYRRFLMRALASPKRTAAICLVLPISGFLLSSTLGQQFFPPADRNQFEIQVRMAPDSSIERTAAVSRAIETRLRKLAGVAEVHWRIGGSYPTIYYNRIMTEQSNNAYAHAMVFTDSLASANTLTATLPAILGDEFTEAQIIVAPFAQGKPVDAPVGFEISGPDIDVLRRLGDEVRRIMHTVPGVLQTRATVSGGLATLSFVADEIAAADTGLNLSQLATQMQADLEGQAGGALFEDLEELPVVVRLEGRERSSLSSVAGLVLNVPGRSDWVPLSGLGEMVLKPEVSLVSRKNGARINDILAYLAPDVLAIDVTNEVLNRLAEADFHVPPGYRFSIGGDSAEQSDALRSLFTYLPILLMLMVATIVLSFRSLRLAGIIGAVAVLSVGLGMLSLWIGGYARGFNAIIGAVGLIGVAINGTIVVLAGIRSNADAIAGDLSAIVDETLNATRHIVSTTLTTVGGFVPLLLFTGGDFWPPLAIVIAGGIAFSITLSLLFSPAMYFLTLPKESSPSVGSAVPAT